ncbi:MAG: serine hydrolase [Bacteroidales bacterium]|mgnify:FL=1|jgi:CubicO group peptidase (beta-lactamase class C family)|nr:serine hydrolase [Bacteroidales bacterium]MDX9927043.1 serine hydrolase domain-containing protein [Bacteroidales bacterium]HNX83055.1 serine hydrolase domain-containing protein [Bacteroidales bacterium]HOC47669.1 serine hydrolase domain-containing protein [Bacteroidales bacterium]HPS97248.1 serine hydrolase domain-containing protein [Bacteroidales bacterium]
MKKAVLSIILAISLQSMNGQMQQAIERIAGEYGLMGLSVVAVCDGKITGEWYTGLRDYDRNLPVDENTKYRIASISKFVMTTAMMKLCDQKRLDLDADAGDYLGFRLRNPNHPEKPVTVRMLLLHTGSLNEGSGYDPFLMATYNNVGNPPSFSELFAPGGKYYTDDMWRKEAPGEYYTYCNANFGLAGTIIERITGQRFEEYIQQTLFIPLGISGSYIAEGVTDINNLAVIYGREDGKWIPGTDDYKGMMSSPRDFSGYVTGTNGAVFSPQGGLRISAAELARIMILHMNKGKYEGKRIISGKSIRLMHRAQFITTPANSDNEGVRAGNRGLSVQILTGSASGSILPEGSHFLGHSGSAYGLVSDFYFDPKKKYGFIFITNGIAGGPEAGSSGSFYNFEEALIRALHENSEMPCK